MTPIAERRSRRLRVALGAAAAIVALAVAGVVVTRSGGDTGTDVALEADTIPGASGTANLLRTDSGWRIELDATGLPGATTASSTRPGCATPTVCSSRSGRSTRAPT